MKKNRKNKNDNTQFFSRPFFAFLLMAAVMMGCGGAEEGEVAAEEEVFDEPTAVEEEEPAAELWNYENANWEEIENTDCATNVQSPVNIIPDDAIPALLDDIEYNYEPFPMTIVDNGHTIQAYGAENSTIVLDEKDYKFLQLHFHAPSEHAVEGEHFPMEMHLVHQEVGSDDLVVLGIFIEEAEEVNPFLEKIFAELPDEEGVPVETEVEITLSDFIPPSQKYYTYIGSLTTPPCTVGVNWILFEEAIPASAEQIAQFKALYSNTARPLQELENRRVFTTME
ncbi:carbonic anhydrase [Nafulsella turpanensis]|uniref:carbonic anhydrase n=1 Tax=Nafulsella turpanensis TaxID=1265690 RepID=UPI000344E71E|nr:carbonic anhydrase family protein [Nafulsella turpanensis]